jgi:heme-degrading monooxygenase HmoA
VDPADQWELTELARATQPIFAHQPGFLAATLLRSADGTRLLHLLRWRTLADSDASLRSPEWASEAGARFMAFIGAGKATLEVVPYELIASVEAGD